MIEGLLDLFHTPRCLLCGKQGRQRICAQCLARFEPVDGKICDVCGAPLFDRKTGVCTRCANAPPPFSVSRSVLIYERKARDAIIAAKFKGKSRVLDYLFPFLDKYFTRNNILLDAYAIAPAPGRGSNERIDAAKEMAKMLSETTGIPLTDVLRWKRKTTPQHRLNLQERWENVKDAFEVEDAGKIKGKVILLVDDIYTTGATATNCSKALKEAGALKVKVLTLARRVMKEFRPRRQV